MPTIEQVDQQLRKNAIIKGLMLGAIVLALSIFSFYFITGLTKTMSLIVAGPYFFSVIFPIIFIVLFCLNMRKKLGGYWTFRQAVTAIFIMFMVSYAILAIGRDLIFAKFIEPDIVPKTEAVMMNVRYQSLKISGASDKEIKSQEDELRKEIESQKNPGIMPVVQNYMINIIMLFVLAIIFAAILKKEPLYTIRETIVTEE